jgi:homoserine O-succinyltransferase
MPAHEPAVPRPGALVIGLVNSMPGEARRHTEQQFRAILSAAARDLPVELRLFSLTAGPRDADMAAPRYQDTAALAAAVPDGLIVSGMPPRAARLSDEPYWPRLTALVDVATEAAIPTVWSCLAAHAAVLYRDGIERQPLPRKLSGLVDCARTEAEHPAMRGLPRRWRVPHSRYNDLPEAALRARGYRILSRAAAAGADIFARDDRAPFLFCQGHPEYDAHSLLREYRRDIRQFLAGARDDYPAAPDGCFSPALLARLDGFRARALRVRSLDCLAEFPMAACEADLRHDWRDLAVSLYANWLAEVAARARLRAAPGAAARSPAHSSGRPAAARIGSLSGVP